MTDRLNDLIANKGLSANRLARLLDIQPSAVSHILSGRNKPGYNIISKLLQAFPDVNARWLLTGEGEMYLPETFVTLSDNSGSENNRAAESVTEDEPQPAPERTENSQVSEPNKKNEASSSEKALPFPDSRTLFYMDVDCPATEETAERQYRHNKDAENANRGSAGPALPPEPAVSPEVNTNRKETSDEPAPLSPQPVPERIVLIYSDRTFEVLSSRNR